MNSILRPLALVYNQVVNIKNALYERGILKPYQAPVPVISIGNLTVGGTGKTPLTDYCLKGLVARGKKVAVISRSYRAKANRPCRVDAFQPYAAQYFGDEPVLLAQNNPQVHVYVGPTKWQTARFAASQGQYDLFIVDDGFQHRKLKRDLNIVILDATEALSNYEVLPLGRARESWGNLSRADVIILSKCNLTTNDQLRELESRLPAGKPVLSFGYEITKVHNDRLQLDKGKDEILGKKFFLVSAIARPDVFENMIGNLGEISKQSVHFEDHHQYTPAEAQHLMNLFNASKADILLTTEKDAVKLRSLIGDGKDLWTAVLSVAELNYKGRLNEIIRQAVG